MKRALILLSLSFLITLVAGCSTIKSIFSMSSKDNIEPPKELTVFAPTARVQRLWHASIGKGAQKSGVAISPAVVDGRVYACSTNGNLEALDAVSGKSLWRLSNKFRYSGGPTVVGDLLAVGTLDGEVQLLNARDGSERWHVAVTSEVISAPAIGDGIVVVRAHDGHIFGLDAQTGARKWTYDRSSMPLLSLRGNSAPILKQGVIFDGADNGKVVALRSSDGALLWEQALSTNEGRSEIERIADVDGIVTVDSGVVYAVGYRGQVAALVAQSGRSLWTRDMSSFTGVSASTTQLYISDADSDVWALDKRTGTPNWKQDAFEHRWLSPATTHGDYIVFGDLEGYVHWLTASDGTLAARERLSKDAIQAAPVVVEDVAYVSSSDGELAAFRISKP
jgi:outer membrane protein assembly factor BamB